MAFFHTAVCLSPLKDKTWANLKCIKYTNGFQSFRILLVWEESVLLKTVCWHQTVTKNK